MARNYRDSVREDPNAGFGRPAKRSRPRTKDRPDYSKAPQGMVIGVDRGRYRCLVLEQQREIVAMRARSLGRKSVIVGDQVRLDGDISGREGTLARIVEVRERKSVLRRTADDDDPYERPVVANADQLVIVTALADPPPRPGMIDRILVAAYDSGLEPLLVLTKADLALPDDLVGIYSTLGVRTIVSEPDADLSELRSLLAKRISVLVGHSGVGKSTLINALIPGANRTTGEVNEITGRGRHTSTSAIALELPAPGGWVIDTPGVRSFGLSHVTIDSIIAAFPDLAQISIDCPRGCRHESDSIECALDAAVATGQLAANRLDSFRRMERAWAPPSY